MTERLVARLAPAASAGGTWRWDLAIEGEGQKLGSLLLPDLRLRGLLTQLERVDHVLASSDFAHATASRNTVVEVLLDLVWSELILPLVPAVADFSQLTLVVPAQLARLPLSSARSAHSGESLVHICEVEVHILADGAPAVVEAVRGTGRSCPASTFAEPLPLPGPRQPHYWDPQSNVHRFDSHLEELPAHLSAFPLSADATVLLMGCRTALLLPILEEAQVGQAVVSSWDVEDRHCAPFGDALMSAMANGLPAAAALRSVQASMTASPPYRWAGYAVLRIATGSESPMSASAADRGGRSRGLVPA